MTVKDEGESRAGLSEEIHQTLKQLEDQYELVQQDAEDLSSGPNWARRRDSGGTAGQREREKADLAALVTRMGEDIRTCANLSISLF